MRSETGEEEQRKHRKTVCVCVCVCVSVFMFNLADMNSDLYSQLSLHNVLNVFVLTFYCEN